MTNNKNVLSTIIRNVTSNLLPIQIAFINLMICTTINGIVLSSDCVLNIVQQREVETTSVIK